MNYREGIGGNEKHRLSQIQRKKIEKQRKKGETMKHKEVESDVKERN
jgi:hypothetical protein